VSKPERAQARPIAYLTEYAAARDAAVAAAKRRHPAFKANPSHPVTPGHTPTREEPTR
jgi:hypothetical protein